MGLSKNKDIRVLQLLNVHPLHDQDEFPNDIIRNYVASGFAYLYRTYKEYQRGRTHIVKEYKITEKGKRQLQYYEEIGDAK